MLVILSTRDQHCWVFQIHLGTAPFWVLPQETYSYIHTAAVTLENSRAIFLAFKLSITRGFWGHFHGVILTEHQKQMKSEHSNLPNLWFFASIISINHQSFMLQTPVISEPSDTKYSKYWTMLLFCFSLLLSCSWASSPRQDYHKSLWTLLKIFFHWSNQLL